MQRSHSFLRRVRTIAACILFTLITLLFLDFTGTLHHHLRWVAQIQFLPAVMALNVGVMVGIVVLTLICGRIYCSVICPLGVMQDLLARLNRKKNKFRYHGEIKWLRYLMWVLFVIAIIAGMGSFVALLAPYSAYGRIVQTILQPIYIGINNGLAAIASHYGSYAFYSREVWLRSLPTLLIAVCTFVGLLMTAFSRGRLYCNSICPVGTTLSFFSRFSFLQIQFDKDKCRQCGKCEKNCKAECIDVKHMTVDASRCVVCGNCLEQCAFDALHYESRLHRPKAHPKDTTPTDESRRAFLTGSAIALGTLATAEAQNRVDGGLAVIEQKQAPHRLTPLTPPGSLSAKNMQQRCTGCQLCVSECPNDVLRPSTDLFHLMQPTMSFERGYCRPECTRCASVCPAGAIQPITKEEKAGTQIGHAVWEPWNCLPATDGTSCGNCQRHCPTGAIQMVPLKANDPQSPLVPAVNTEKCIGCGSCEYHCPSRPYPAIYVEGNEVHHLI